MSLFKPLRGSRVTLDAQPLHDGYAYFCTDDGSFHIDYTDADGNLQRKQINAKDAETLCGMTLEELKAEIATQDTVVLAEAQAYADGIVSTKADATHTHEVSYNDLLDKPSHISTVNGVAPDDNGNVEIAVDGVTSWDDLENKPELSTVATSGSYNDLADKPTLGSLASKDTIEVADLSADLQEALEGGYDDTVLRNELTAAIEVARVDATNQDAVVLSESQAYTDAALEMATTQDAVILHEAQSYTDDTLAQAKTEIKSYVDTEISQSLAGSGGLTRVIVDTLPNPTEADSDAIYMIPMKEEIAHTALHPGHLVGDVGGALSGFGENPEADCLFYPIVPGQTYTITSEPYGNYDYAWIVDGYQGSYSDGWILMELDGPGTFTAPANGVGLWVNVIKGATPKLLTTKSDGLNIYEEYMLINGAFELIGNTSVDLSDYVHKSELANYMTREEVVAYINEVILGGEW